MNLIKVGIDPGAKGGLAWGDHAVAAKMPDSALDLADLLRDIMSEGVPVRVFLEEVGGYVGGPGAPGSAMFNFGKNYGIIIGVCATLALPVESVRPQRWQKALGLGTSAGLTKSQWKNKLKVRAQSLFPHVKVTLDTADALLILHAANKDLI